jgi:hypothetical protein
MTGLPKLVHAFGAKNTSLANLHGMACTVAETTFKEFGSVPATFLVATGESVLIFTAPWNDAKEKKAATFFMVVVLQSLDAHAYAFVSETWTAMLKRGDDESAEDFHKRGEAACEMGIDELPPEMVDETLMIATQTRRNDRMLSRFLLNTKSKTPFLGPRVDEPYTESSVDGRLLRLLDAPPLKGKTAMFAGVLLMRMISKLETKQNDRA